MDALFGLIIMSMICTLLYPAYISLINTYQNTNQSHMKRVSSWEE